MNVSLPNTISVIIRTKLVPTDQIVVLAVEESSKSPLVTIPLTFDFGPNIRALRGMRIRAITFAGPFLRVGSREWLISRKLAGGDGAQDFNPNVPA